MLLIVTSRYVQDTQTQKIVLSLLIWSDASPLTFDPDTVHQFLRVTNDGRKLTNTTPWQHGYPDQTARFQHYKQALAVQNFFSGRHYFEADLHGAGVHVGVTYASIARQGDVKEACLTSSSFSWCIEWNGRAFSAWHEDVETVLSVPKATRVGIYVDFEGSIVAFYGVGLDAGMTIMHRYEVELEEPLYPAVFLPKKENVVVLVEPGDEVLLKSPPPCSPPWTKPMADVTDSRELLKLGLCFITNTVLVS